MKRTVCLFIVLMFSSLSMLTAGGRQESPLMDMSAEEFEKLPSGRVFSGGMTLEWRVEGEEMIFTLLAPTSGWASVGIDPVQVMKGAQLVIGYVTDSGEMVLRDEYGSGTFSHRSDIGLGTTDDVRAISGIEANGMLEMTFALPLQNDDPYDVPLTLNAPHTIIMAFGADGEDNFTSKHVGKTKVTVRF